jgi:hypothetical protein
MSGDRVTLLVTINGTSVNPWRKMGLRQNPFPQLGIAELQAGEEMIASLDGDPVTCEQDIRDRLAGCTDELIEGCIARWQPGKRVRFSITFPRERITP